MARGAWRVARGPAGTDAGRPLSARRDPLPEPGPGELLIEVLVCGVCRTDLHVTGGDLPVHRPGVTSGHEVVGRVVETRSEGFAVGDRVGVAWLRGVPLPPARRGEPLPGLPLHRLGRARRLRRARGRPADFAHHLSTAAPPSTRADARELLDFAAGHRPRVVTRSYPPDRVDIALTDLAADRVEGAAVLVT